MPMCWASPSRSRAPSAWPTTKASGSLSSGMIAPRASRSRSSVSAFTAAARTDQCGLSRRERSTERDVIVELHERQPLLAPVVHEQVVSNRVEPGGEAGLRSVATTGFDYPDPGLLEKLLGGGAVPG